MGTSPGQEDRTSLDWCTSSILVERVAVTRLRDNIFYATVWVKVGDHVHEVDARPSDAMNLALRARAPIFMAPELFEQTRIYLLTQEGDPPEGGYVIRMADGRQMQGPELCPLLDEWHRQDLGGAGLASRDTREGVPVVPFLAMVAPRCSRDGPWTSPTATEP